MPESESSGISKSKGSYETRSSGTKTNREVLKIPDLLNFWNLDLRDSASVGSPGFRTKPSENSGVVGLPGSQNLQDLSASRLNTTGAGCARRACRCCWVLQVRCRACRSASLITRCSPCRLTARRYGDAAPAGSR